MQLTIYTDYALRTLMYLGVNVDRPVSVAEVAGAFGISTHHLAKVAKDLVKGGFVHSHRGRAGGLQLALSPSRIKVGTVVRYTETLNLLECFDRATSTCPLTGACRLERTLHDAQEAFLSVLDRTTLADILENPQSFALRLARGRRGAGSRTVGRPVRRRRAVATP